MEKAHNAKGASTAMALLFGGSAGVYVLDGSTGRTRMVQRIGHAQTHIKCGAMRKDLSGPQ